MTVAPLDDGAGLDRLYTSKQIAPLPSLAPSFIERKAREGDLPHVHLGRYRRFRLSDVRAWLASQSEGRAA